MDLMTDWGRQLSVGAEDLASHLAREPGDDLALWLDGLEERVCTLRAGLAGLGRCLEHGGYDHALDEAPRLGPALGRLTAERSRLLDMIGDVLQAIDVERRQARPDVERLARQARIVLLRVRMATHRAMSVAIDAYEVDIGGPG